MVRAATLLNMAPKRVLLPAIFLLIPLFVSGESYYFTFVDEGNGPPLQASDVTFQINKTPVKISELVRVPETGRDERILFHPAGRRTYLIVLDFVNSTADEIVEARLRIQSLLPKLPADDLVAVGSIQPKDGLRILCSPTADRGKVILGLNSIGKEAEPGLVEGPEGNFYPETLGEAAEPEWIPEDNFLAKASLLVLPEKDREAGRPVFLQALVDLAFLLSTMTGRKDVILFSGGVKTEGLSIQLPIEEKIKAAKASSASEMSHEEMDTLTDTSIERVNARADAGPSRKTKKENPSVLPDVYAGCDAHIFAFPTVGGVQDIVRTMVEKTGGQVFPAESFISDVLEKMLDSDRNYYAIRWEEVPPDSKQLSEILLSASGRKTRSSKVWLAPRQISQYTSMDRKVDVAEMIYKDSRRCGYCRFWADTVVTLGGLTAPVFLEIPADVILRRGDSLDVELMTYALSGEVIEDFSYLQISLDLKNKKLRERLGKSGLKIWNVLKTSGDSPLTIRGILRDQNTGITESVNFDLRPPATGLAVSQPFFPATSFDWVMWPKPEDTISRRGIEFHYPYRMGSELFFPDLAPILNKGQAGQVFYVRLDRVTAATSRPPIQLTLVDAQQKETEVKDFGLLKPPAAGVDSEELFWKLTAIPDIPAGEYQLRVKVANQIRTIPIKLQ